MARPMKMQARPQPEGEVRQSQLVTTFGPGAMMDLIDQAVLVSGLDFWGYDRKEGAPVINEPRLRDALVERFRDADRELSYEAFRGPPACSDDEAMRGVGVPVVEFPTWFVCQNPACRALVRKDQLEVKAGRRVHRCTGAKTPSETVPVRFLAACKRGHCEDFPWVRFVHEVQGAPRCAAPRLTLREGSTGDFSEITVACTCEAPAVPLSRALGAGQMFCGGHRPWLGDAREECGEPLRLLVRTASNSYFSQVVSALSVPEPGKEIEEAIQEHWEILKAATAETLPAFLTIPKVQASVGRFSPKDLLRAISRLHQGSPSAGRLPLRTAEYTQFLAAPGEAAGDLPGVRATFFARRARLDPLPEGVARVVLAPKLREVRAQVGFTRLEPVTADLQGEFDIGVTSARLGLAADWLPATEVLGEGVFVQLDEAAVHAWEQRKAVKERARELEEGYRAWAALNAGAAAPPFLGPRFYLLHSLSHLLISAISLECGYSASAIRERIYCAPSGAEPTAMAAVLLSTGTSGTEGTLGGLVEQGRRIREHLQRAYDLGRLCSNDPLCAAHSPKEDRAERFLEGAACHGCLFIAESSCERFNRYLDRALVVPTLGCPPELAFFGRRP